MSDDVKASKLDLGVAVLEDKMRSAWDLINKMREK